MKLRMAQAILSLRLSVSNSDDAKIPRFKIGSIIANVREQKIKMGSLC